MGIRNISLTGRTNYIILFSAIQKYNLREEGGIFQMRQAETGYRKLNQMHLKFKHNNFYVFLQFCFDLITFECLFVGFEVCLWIRYLSVHYTLYGWFMVGSSCALVSVIFMYLYLFVLLQPSYTIFHINRAIHLKTEFA